MYLETDAKKMECPYKDKKCVTDKCMGWEWVSKFGDIVYENALSLKDEQRKSLEDAGYAEIPSHGLGLALKQFYPMTDDERQKVKNNTFGTQLFFGLETKDKTKWVGDCTCVGIKDPS